MSSAMICRFGRSVRTGRRAQPTRRAIEKASVRRCSRFAKRSQAVCGWADIPMVDARQACWRPKRPVWWMVFYCSPILYIRLESRHNCERPISLSSGRRPFLSTVRATHSDRSRNYDRPFN